MRPEARARVVAPPGRSNSFEPRLRDALELSRSQIPELRADRSDHAGGVGDRRRRALQQARFVAATRAFSMSISDRVSIATMGLSRPRRTRSPAELCPSAGGCERRTVRRGVHIRATWTCWPRRTRSRRARQSTPPEARSP